MFLEPDAQGASTAMTVRDPHRLPNFDKKGELIVLNPSSYARWLKNQEKHNTPELLHAKWMYNTARDPKLYSKYDAVPAPYYSPKDRTPVDLLLKDAQHSLLHEVSLCSCRSSVRMLVTNNLEVAVPHSTIWRLGSRRLRVEWLVTCCSWKITARYQEGKPSWYVHKHPTLASAEILIRPTEILAIVVAVVQMYGEGYRVDVARATVHRIR